MPFLARIAIYPIKAMGPVFVEEARLLRSGALEHDRAIGLFDADGKFVNGKRFAAIHRLRLTLDPTLRTIHASVAPAETHRVFHLDQNRAELEAWLGEYFGFSVNIRENSTAGWPDDTDSPGPTLISTATLREVASWFPGLTVEQARVRFRTNLEIDGVEPFWEDRLFGPAGTLVSFRVGDARIEGVNPCQRCVVPPRDPFTGENYPDFSNTFRARRQQTLPPWAQRSRFNHFYRLAINTRVAEDQAGRVMRVGDRVDVV